MTTTMLFNVQYVLVTCGADGCDQAFGMSRDFYDETQRKGIGWHCPRGHPRIWKGKTTEQKLTDAQARETALNDQLRAAVREADDLRVQLLHDRQRFANGVCPCCNRSFENVRRHMVTQHPEFPAKDLTKATAFECSCGGSFETLRGLRIHQGQRRRPGWDRPDTRPWTAHLTEV